jgi:hypothetical protein
MVLASSRPLSSQVRTWCLLSPDFLANSSAVITAILSICINLVADARPSGRTQVLDSMTDLFLLALLLQAGIES